MTDDVKEAIEYFKDRQDIIFANADRKKHIKTLIRAAQSANKVEVLPIGALASGFYGHLLHAECNTDRSARLENYIRQSFPHGLIIKPDAVKE